MSGNTFNNAIKLAHVLCNKAFVNGIAGQEERALRYTALALEQLGALVRTLEARGGFRKMQALDDMTHSIWTEAHPAFQDLPAFDEALVEPALARWEHLEFQSATDILRRFHDVPEALQEILRLGEAPPR